MKNRGFTLIEVMVGAVVAILVIGVVMGTFLSQQRAMQTLDLSREASGAGRDALLSLQETIGRAGYGIDPRYAFDLRVYNCTNYSVATTAANACRDKVDAPDQLVFVERDPNYYWAGGPTTTFQGCDDTNAPCSGHAWQVTSFTTTSPYRVVINARTGDRFPIGQVVEITCAKGANPQMGTVTAVSGNPPGSVTLTLANPVTNNHYTDNIQGASGTTLHDACFDGNGVSLFLVNRYRYFVMSIVPQQPVGAPVPPAEPWLLLDRGLDYNGNGTTPENGGDNSDLIPIARGVEGFQVAYLLKPPSGATPAAPDNNTNWVVGDSPGVVEEPDPFATAPLQNTADTDAARFTMHPANIRGVRVRLTVRSLLKDLAAGAAFPGDPAVPAGQTSIENRNDFTTVTLGQLRRYFSSVAVATPNLNSKDPFIF